MALTIMEGDGRSALPIRIMGIDWFFKSFRRALIERI